MEPIEHVSGEIFGMFQNMVQLILDLNALCAVMDENKVCIHSQSKRSSQSEEALVVKQVIPNGFT